MNEEQRKHLIEGLVGEKHRGLYLHNAWFHAGVEQLAQMLPLFVDGLAANAATEEAKLMTPEQRQDLMWQRLAP